MPAPRRPHQDLLPYCTSDKERDAVLKWREGGSSQAAADTMGYSCQSSIVRIVAKIRNRAEKQGYAGPHWEEPEPRPPGPEEESIDAVEEHRLKRIASQLKSELKELTKQLAEEKQLNVFLSRPVDYHPAPIAVPKKGAKRPQVAASAFLSDLHLDESVDLEESGGFNEYNRPIAEKRLERFTSKTVEVSRDLFAGFDVVHLDLPFGGDLVSGNIHEELARSNEAEIMDTVDHWSERLADVVVTLAKEFKTVRVPCVVGNHGRNTKKPRHKGRVRDNYDWLICKTVEKFVVKYAGCRNVEFLISESTDQLYTTMGWRYCLTHGDQASGGSGWGGIFSPIMRLHDKKTRAYQSHNLGYDYLLMGHWHRFTDAGDVLVNGTLKGYDEFAHNLNFPAEPPSQAFWLTDPERGKIFSGPLFVDDTQLRRENFGL